MYRYINQHIEALLDLLRKDKHVQNYDNLMRAFAQADALRDETFRRNYAHFWKLRRVKAWREAYFVLLQNIRNQTQLDPREILRYVCHETLDNHKGGQALEFSFATKLVHMVDPKSPIYDANVRVFYLLPELPGDDDMEARIHRCLGVYDALAKEYERILTNGLLCHSIARFKEELNPERFTDIKIIDSLIWAFVTWAKQGPAFGKGELQYE